VKKWTRCTKDLPDGRAALAFLRCQAAARARVQQGMAKTAGSTTGERRMIDQMRQQVVEQGRPLRDRAAPEYNPADANQPPYTRRVQPVPPPAPAMARPCHPGPPWDRRTATYPTWAHRGSYGRRDRRARQRCSRRTSRNRKPMQPRCSRHPTRAAETSRRWRPAGAANTADVGDAAAQGPRRDHADHGGDAAPYLASRCCARGVLGRSIRGRRRADVFFWGVALWGFATVKKGT